MTSRLSLAECCSAGEHQQNAGTFPALSGKFVFPKKRMRCDPAQKRRCAVFTVVRAGDLKKEICQKADVSTAMSSEERTSEVHAPYGWGKAKKSSMPSAK